MRSRINVLLLHLALAAIVLLAAPTVPPVFAQTNDSPAAAGNLPFDEWLNGKNISQIPWTIRVAPPALTEYQRYQTSITAYVFLDKADASTGNANLFSVARFTDLQGKSFDATSWKALRFRTADQDPEIVVNFTAYLLPGEYKVAMAVYGTGSHKHCVTHQTLRVPPIPNDPLPGAWANLPEVEFLPPHPPLGLVGGRLRLPLPSNQPVRVEVIANFTPTYAMKPASVVYWRNRDELFPELSVLSQITPTNGSLDVDAVELDNQQVVFEQHNIGTFDASSLWKALNAHTKQIIGQVSASALASQVHEASFLTAEVNKRITAAAASSNSGTAHSPAVIIVLSGEMSFPRGEDLSPIKVTDDCNCRVFYIRTHAVLDPNATEWMFNLPETQASPSIIGDMTVAPELMPPPQPPNNIRTQAALRPGDGKKKIHGVDQLEKTLAPLHPRVFDVDTPADFRKALAAILSDASSM